jgi:GGDEF domain-containing protein
MDTPNQFSKVFDIMLKINVFFNKKHAEWFLIIGLGSILLAINIVFFSKRPGFLGIIPNPYWIVVLPTATGFGFRAGVLAGLSCAIIVIGYAGYEMNINNMMDFIQFFKKPEIFGQFLLFIGGGSIIGEVREVKNRKLRELKMEYEDLEDGYGQLSKAYDQLSEVNKEVDKRVTGKETTLLKLYQAEQSLKSLRERDVYPAVIEILKDFISIEACSIYRLHDNQLKMTARLNDNSSRIKKRRKAFSVMKKAIKTKETISMFNHPCIIICAPFMDSKNQVIGLINIEKVPKMKVNPQTARMTTLIAQQCAAAIQNASAYEETKKHHITDDMTGALTFEYFLQRLDEELQRSRRYKYTFSIVTFDIQDYTQFHKSVRDDLRLALTTIIFKRIRGVDLLFLDIKPNRFLLFLPNTPFVGAQVVKSRIGEYIDTFGFQPYPKSQKRLQINIQIVEYSDQMNGYEDIFKA